MMTFVLATRNAHKVAEIRALLPETVSFLTLHEFPGAPKTVEDADSFSGNAAKKSVELAHWLAGISSDKLRPAETGEIFALADDSGLEVDALNGAPGIYSARFAAEDSGGKENSPDAANNEKLLRLLENIPPKKRTARFRCCIALTPVASPEIRSHSPVCAADEVEFQTEIFEGTCEGKIIASASGQGGFGYDPLFVPQGFEKSFAELGDVKKNKISHRAKALEKLRKRLAG
ncbi:MAG: non-canonical purine NTP pyrophosphatase [Verrucomicrobiota bacterium]